MIGSRLSHFEVTAKLGEGGMGVVWRAEDTKLGREVAIKVLPEAVAEDPERLARFEREARLLASLNHPNIAGIHQVEQDGGKHFLVMELAEGETLQEILARGPVALEAALPVAMQIAAALEAAHARGIVHRDLKPGNVKVSPSGEVKVLDFGLAKALEVPASGAAGAHALSVSPTLTAQMTQAGVLLGTAAYMSPEQARGQEADKRADIWAFGVILWEMLTGTKMFAGDTVSDTLAAVLRADLEWGELPDDTPRPVRRLLRRCLERDPDRRLHDIADARLEIEDALAGRGHEAAATVAEPPPRSQLPRLLPWAVAALLALGIAWLLVARPEKTAEAPLRKLQIAEMDEVSLFGFGGPGGVISPDGSAVAYVSDGKLWLRRLDVLEPRQIPGSNFESSPFWSPDSRWLAFPVGRTLWKVSVEGGEPRAIAELPTNIGPFGGGWGEDDRIILTTGYSGLLEVSAKGGDLKQVLAPDPETEADFHTARLLPGGRGVLFGIHYKNRPEGPLGLWDGHSRKILLEGEGLGYQNAVYSPSGHLLYERGPTNRGLWAAPFSLDELEVTGEPFLVMASGTSPSVARDGTLVFTLGVEAELRRLLWLDRSGRELGFAGVEQRGIADVALSRSGDRVALSAIEAGRSDIWIQDLGRDTKNQITFLPGMAQGPTFSPDGRRIAYYLRSNEPELYMIDLGSRSEPVRIAPGGRPDWSANGRDIVYELYGARGLWYVELDDEGRAGEPRLILDPPGDESEPALSPSSQLLAYAADESGRFEVYLTRFPDGKGKWQVSLNGGRLPRWGGSDDELFFIGTGGRLMSARVTDGQPPVIGAPVALFDGIPYGMGGDPTSYAPSADGKRFLVARGTGEVREKPKLLLVQNWFAEFAGRP